MEKLICEVCGKGAGVEVANCTLGQAISHAYCKKCLMQAADPLSCFMVTLELVGPEYLASWIKAVRSYKDGHYIDFPEILQLYEARKQESPPRLPERRLLRRIG